MQGLHAPLMEDKVVEFILEMAKVKDKTVSIDELTKEPEEAPKKKAKKAPAAKKDKPAVKKKAAPKKKVPAAKKAAPKKDKK